MFGKVYSILQCAALRQFHHYALCNAASVGSHAYHDGVAERSRCCPFNVGIACHSGHFGSHCTHYVAGNPARSRALQLDGLLDGVGVYFGAVGVGCEADAVILVAEHNLPVFAIEAEDTHDVAGAHWQRLAAEVSITAVAHCECVAVGIHNVAIGVFLFSCESGNAVGIFKVNIVDAYKLALHANHVVGLFGQFAYRIDGDGVDLRDVGHTAYAYVRLEEFLCHERCFPPVVTVIGLTELLQAVKLANEHVAHVQYHFLPDAELGVHVGVAHRDGKCGRSVLNVDAVVDVARLVGADYASLDVQAVVVGGKAYGVDVVAGIVPILLFEVVN